MAVLAYLSVLILGTGMLFPFNAFITAVDYFDALFNQYHPEYAFPVVFNVVSLASTLFLVKWGRIIATATRRTWVGLMLHLVTMITMLFMVWRLDFEDGSWLASWQQISFILVMFVVVLCGISTATLQASLYGLVGNMPPRYTQALFVGSSCSGVVVSASRALTKASFADDTAGLKSSSLVYFGIACALAIACLVAMWALERMEVTREYLCLVSRTASRGNTPPREGDAFESIDNDEDAEDLPKARVGKITLYESEQDKEGSEALLNNYREPVTVRLSVVCYKLRWFAPVVFVTFWLTLSLFPGVVVTMRGGMDVPGNWLPIILISCFNVGDLFGRIISSNSAIFGFFQGKLLQVLAVLRLSFWPLFIFGARSLGFYSTPVVCVLVLLFAITNGFVGSIAMMLGPTMVESHEKEVAGTIMALSLISGLAIGSASSYLVLLAL